MAITNERALQLFYAIKLHFDPKSIYNAVDSNYNVIGIEHRVTYSTDIKVIWKITKKFHDENELILFFIFCMIHNTNSIYDITNKKFSRLMEEFPLFYHDVMNSQKTFEDDMYRIINKYGSMNNTFKSIGGERPKILDILLQRELSYISIVILDSMIGLINKVDRIFLDDTLWKREKTKLIRMMPFFGIIDNEKYVKIVNKVRQR